MEQGDALMIVAMARAGYARYFGATAQPWEDLPRYVQQLWIDVQWEAMQALLARKVEYEVDPAALECALMEANDYKPVHDNVRRSDAVRLIKQYERLSAANIARLHCRGGIRA